LDELAQSLVGSQKIPTTLDLWMRCAEGDVSAFEEMEEYNLGDVYDTLFRVWLRTAYYNPHKAIDFSNPNSNTPNCRVDGSVLDEVGVYLNKRNGLEYILYLNTKAGIMYRDRYNVRSKKSNNGYIIPHIGY
jgi:hypothetical protein